MDSERFERQYRSGLAGGSRILVIDDDELARAGIVGALGQIDHSFDVIALGFDEALTASIDGVAAAVVEAVDPTSDGDQVAGARIVQHLRHSTTDPVRIVVTCSVLQDDAVRRRMYEVGVDRYLHRGWARNRGDLRRAVLEPFAPELAVPAPVDLGAMHRLGIDVGSRVNGGVQATLAEGLVHDYAWVGPQGRDRFARRVRFNDAARLRPVTVEGLTSEHGEIVPSLRQVQRFFSWAARVVDCPPRPGRQSEYRPAQQVRMGTSEIAARLAHPSRSMDRAAVPVGRRALRPVQDDVSDDAQEVVS
ncbi:hypothetical protein [Aquihabitans sp. McL0605]|uniref:hypothetical protein n=1 Tax=Aquihabitans sp. McL0605 TaxID=3415671 RepID=UPI003CEC5D89